MQDSLPRPQQGARVTPADAAARKPTDSSSQQRGIQQAGAPANAERVRRSYSFAAKVLLVCVRTRGNFERALERSVLGPA